MPLRRYSVFQPKEESKGRTCPKHQLRIPSARSSRCSYGRYEDFCLTFWLSLVCVSEVIADVDGVVPGMSTRQLSEQKIQQVLVLGRAATYASNMIDDFKDMRSPALVQALHMQSATVHNALAPGTMSEEAWGTIQPLVDSLGQALNASSAAQQNTELRDIIMDGEASGSDAESYEDDDYDVGRDMELMYTSSEEAFVKILRGTVVQLKASTAPAVISI